MEHQDRDKLYAIVRDVRIAMLTTLDGSGNLSTRPMASQAADDQGDLWFFTDRTSTVAEDILLNPNVSVGYASPEKGEYASMTGTAQLISDRAILEAHWNEYVKIWFPNGIDDPDLVMIRVNPSQGEYWDANTSLVAKAVGLAKAVMGKSDPDDLGHNAKVLL